jgi:hypothetical protein
MARRLGADLAGQADTGSIVTAPVVLDPESVLAGLKDFQRATVDYVFRRMYLDEKPARRFLVADEVGLGKTLVAKGLIARSIEHLQRKGVRRIDIVYICSNADIARQNVQRLNVIGRDGFNLPTRITMLPLYLHQLKAHGINFVSFTPGTSFDMRSRGGMQQERALLYQLLSHAWQWRRTRHVGVFQVLRVGASLEGFCRVVHQTAREIGPGEHQIDPGLADAFRNELARDAEQAHRLGIPGLRERFESLADRYRRGKHERDNSSRLEIVGALRHALARSCVSALEPDLVILDEFQRFRDLLDGEKETAELARHLFDQCGARVLLLSATPYKMFTLPEESATSDNHYVEFVRTARFLMGSEEATHLERDLGSFGHALHDLAEVQMPAVRTVRKRVERRLRRFMCRTERLAVSGAHDGMLIERVMEGTRLENSDLQAYLAIDRVGRRLGSGDAVEYWKSAPYLMNFMESYKLKRSFHDAIRDPDVRAELQADLAAGGSLLSMRAIEAYQQIDPANARLRGLFRDTLDGEVWRLLWLAPSLPYYQLGAPFDNGRRRAFTKRLIFSAWSVVPQAIAALMSYEAERRMIRAGGRPGRNTLEARRRVRPLLRFQLDPRGDARRVGGMSLFGLMYPCPSLARLVDPFQLSAALGGGTGPLPTREALLAVAEERVAHALGSVVPSTAPRDGAVDERWYWVAPVLLDARGDRSATWLREGGLPKAWSSEDDVAAGGGSSIVNEVIAQALQLASDPASLGRPPHDLPAVLARFSIAGPGVCALRSLARVAGAIDLVDDARLRNAAARIAWGFRSLFNIPETMAMLRDRSGEEDVYWRQVLDYSLRGCLQAVLDEYAHVLSEWLGIIDRDVTKIGSQLGDAMYDALTVRAPSYRVDDIRIQGRGGLTVEPKSMRSRFALRFGPQTVEEWGELQRASQVRTAFNSPFWPFVLATTSVGQEGLDFHLYCHAVVHWNLPANPVDLEQREGRVHRYKGHAIRKNVADANGQAAFKRPGRDPWETLFDAAQQGRDRRTGDLVPFWVYETAGGARIERYVPSLPLSREIEKLERLKRSLAVYRLALGQPRQDDLAAYLADLPEIKRRAIAEELRIDLTPRWTGGRASRSSTQPS